MPANSDIAVWKGNSRSLEIRLKTQDGGTTTPVDLTGSTLVFRAAWDAGSLRKSGSGEGFAITNAAQGVAVLTLTVAETRLFPVGSNIVRYEIERRIGSEQTTVLYGHLRVSEWVNDD